MEDIKRTLSSSNVEMIEELFSLNDNFKSIIDYERQLGQLYFYKSLKMVLYIKNLLNL